MTGLSNIQRRMLRAGEFHFDGWHPAYIGEAAADLERRGLITMTERHGDQYTWVACRITEAGRAALLSERGTGE